MTTPTNDQRVGADQPTWIDAIDPSKIDGLVAGEDLDLQADLSSGIEQVTALAAEFGFEAVKRVSGDFRQLVDGIRYRDAVIVTADNGLRSLTVSLDFGKAYDDVLAALRTEDKRLGSHAGMISQECA